MAGWGTCPTMKSPKVCDIESKALRVCTIALSLALSFLDTSDCETPSPRPLQWKCAAWWGPGGSIKEAKELGFNAVICGFFGDRLDKAIEEGNRLGVDIYLDIEFLGGGKFTQVMTPVEEKLIQTKRENSKPDVATWTPGKRGDPLGLRLWCFARPEALEHGKSKVRRYLEKHKVHGVCIDAIGFRNQYGCFCDYCKSEIPKFAKLHPELAGQGLKDRYSEWVLKKFITELAAFTRSLRPKIKLSAHIEPTFAPNPTFASKLPVDYWLTCVSYYSKPHWDLKTVANVAQLIGNADGKTIGIPYIGYISGKSKKPANRLSRELDIVRNSGVRGIALFELSEIVKNPSVAQMVKGRLTNENHLKE